MGTKLARLGIVPIDSSGAMLLASNLLTIALAVVLSWQLMTILWGYWLQSVIIGLFTFLKLIMLGIGNIRKATIASLGSIFLGFFFAFHYGFFHLAYAVFLAVFSFGMTAFGGVDIFAVLIMGIIFFANHAFSFYKNFLKKGPSELEVPLRDIALWGQGKEAKIQYSLAIGKFAFNAFGEPYARIFPMHLTIIFAGIAVFALGAAPTFVIVFFLLLKTLADLGAHRYKHRGQQ